MNRVIKLNKLGVGRLDNDEPILLPDDVNFEFVALGYDLTNAFVHLKNNEHKGVFRLTKAFKVPNEFLFAGYLNIRVETYLGTEKAKQWDVLPLKIIEIPSGFEIKDYLGELEEKLAKQQERIERLEKQHQIIV